MKHVETPDRLGSGGVESKEKSRRANFYKLASCRLPVPA